MSGELHGHVGAVTQEYRGDELLVTANIGDVVLHLGDVADFDETGGQVIIGGPDGSIYQYIAIDEDADTITLAGLGIVALAASAGERVDVYHPQSQQIASEWVADIIDDTDGSEIQVPISHHLIDLLADGPRSLVGESVVCTRDEGGEWWVSNVVGQVPVQSSPTQPQSFRRRTSAQTITDAGAWTGEWQNVNLSEQIIEGSQAGITWGSTQWTIKQDGVYLVTGWVTFAASATGRRGLRVDASGPGGASAVRAESNGPPNSGSGTALNVSWLEYYTAGSTVRLQAYQNSGGNLDLNSARGCIYKLG